ncbi:MAG: dihydroorotase [Rhodospirillaceae bacterium]|nr:dihydroorotase [Rhodospirillaceae bacterium]
MTINSITIRKPDDCHLHLRDDSILRVVLPYTVSQFARAVIMPNLVTPITTISLAESYRNEILTSCPGEFDFHPLMTCYLTDMTTPKEIEFGFFENVWVAAKLYPIGVTTNSNQGVTDLIKIAPIFECMEKIGMPLLIHGETANSDIDIFDREAVFMENSLLPLLKRYQGLKIVLEHITTNETIDIVRKYAPRIAGTITPHHMMLNRTSLFQGGFQPHHYCLPIAKREYHRLALRKAATSGESCFFIGTDSAPHLRSIKESSCCSAGIFVAATALQSYAQIFAEECALNQLEAFASLNGARFYGLPLNKGTVTLEQNPSRVLKTITIGDDEIVVFRGGELIPWSIKNNK